MVAFGPCRAHAGDVRFRRNVDALAQELLLVGRLDLTQRVNGRRHVDHSRADQALARAIRERVFVAQRFVHCGRRLETKRQPRRPLVERAEESIVIDVVATFVHRKAVGPAVEHRCQERVELRREKDRLDAGPCARLFLAQETADVVLDPRVGRRDEQDLAAAWTAGQQNEDGLGLLDTGQIEKIAVLPVFVVDVPRVHAMRCAPQDRHRAVAQRRHQARPAGLQVLAQRGHLGIGLRRHRDGVPVRRECHDEKDLQQAMCAGHAQSLANAV